METSDEDRIGEIERVLLAETQREVWYDDTRTHGWRATALPTGSRLGVIVGPFSGAGATKLEAAEALLADWRSHGPPARG